MVENFDGWHTIDVTIANGQQPLPVGGSPLAGFFDANAGIDAVFYVHELLFPISSGGWTGVDVTVQSGAGNVAARSTLTAQVDTAVPGGSEEVYYVNADQTIQEMWSLSTAQPKWKSEAAARSNKMTDRRFTIYQRKNLELFASASARLFFGAHGSSFLQKCTSWFPYWRAAFPSLTRSADHVYISGYRQRHADQRSIGIKPFVNSPLRFPSRQMPRRDSRASTARCRTLMMSCFGFSVGLKALDVFQRLGRLGLVCDGRDRE